MEQDEVNGIPEVYEKAMLGKYAELMRAKLGLVETHAGDDKLVTDLLNLMDSSRADYTNLFRGNGKPSPGKYHGARTNYGTSSSTGKRLMIGRHDIGNGFARRKAMMRSAKSEWTP